jgi:hypothetical protein
VIFPYSFPGRIAPPFMLLSVQVLTELQQELILRTVSLKQCEELLFRIFPVRNAALASEVSP